MVFTHIGNGLYTCLAADTKVTTGMTTNSVVIEIDTGNLFYFTAGAWSQLSLGGGGATNLDGLSDVVITSASTGQGIFHNGTNFVNTLIGDANISTHTTTKISTTSKSLLNSNIVYTDQANALGDFNFTLKDNRLLINNPADTFNYTIIAAAIAANRTITLPLLTGNDTMVTEAFTQTLTNKTMSGASNTFSNIPYTALTSIPSTIVKTDQTNTYGAFAQVFPSSQLKVQNPGATFNYIVTGSAIAADRTITLPLLTGNDVVVTEAFSQTLTNKTIATGSNTISGIADANITAHTTSKITTTSKSLLNSSIVYTDQANTFSANDQIIPSTNLKLSNSGFNASLSVGTLGGNITITLPSTTSTLVISTDSRLSDARTPTAHATSHNSGGTDVVHIDTIGAGTDITTNNVSTTKHGLVPKAPNVATQFLDGTGAWSTPAGSGGGEANTYSSSSVGGTDIILTKVGVNLPFKGIAAASTKIAIADDATNKNVTVDVNQANLAIAYSQLTSVPSTIVKTDQSNTFGAFDQTFPSSRLKIQNPGATFNYILAGSAIAADRTVTLPLLTGNDTLATLAFAQTLTNKTISGSSNTITNIGDSSISTGIAHSKIGTNLILSETGLTATRTFTFPNSSGTVSTLESDQTITGAATYANNKLLLRNPADTFSTTVNSGTITAARTITLPITTTTLIGTDTVDIITNKIINAESQTVMGRVWVAPHVKDIGMLSSTNIGVGTYYLCLNMSGVGTPSNLGMDASHGYFNNYASTTTVNNQCGLNSAGYTYNNWNPYFRIKFALPSTTNCRCFIGFINTTTLASSDTFIGNTEKGVGIGFKAADANWQSFTNDGTGTMVAANLGGITTTKDTGVHAVEFQFNNSVPNVVINFYGTSGLISTTTLTTRIPPTGTIFATPAYCATTLAGTAQNFRVYEAYVEHTRTVVPL